MCCPDTPANLSVHRKGGSHHGGTGYPMVRLLALVACGTRTIIDAVFESTNCLIGGRRPLGAAEPLKQRIVAAFAHAALAASA